MKGALLTLFLISFLISVTPVSASDPTRVEVNIWLHGGITEMKSLEQTLNVKFDSAKWYHDWDDAWAAWIPVAYHDAGYIPEMTWQPMITQPDGTNLGVANTDILAGRYDAYIDSMAAGVKALPYRMRISYAAEFNGFWNPWAPGKVGNTTENHKTAWRYIVNRFRTDGANNVDWIWTPNVDPYHVYPSYASMYPGDDVVTYFGLDGYNFGTTGGSSWITFRQVYEQSYNDLQALSHKDIYIMEIGTVEQGGNKAQWITDMFNDLATGFPRIKGLTWWHVVYPQYDMRINTSASAAAAFTAGVNGTNAGSSGSSGISSGSTGSVKDTTTGGGTSSGGASSNNSGSSASTPTNKVTAKTALAQATQAAEAAAASSSGFLLPSIFKGETTIDPRTLFGVALALISLLVTFCYFVTRQVLGRAAKLEAATKAAEAELERRAGRY